VSAEQQGGGRQSTSYRINFERLVSGSKLEPLPAQIDTPPVPNRTGRVPHLEPKPIKEEHGNRTQELTIAGASDVAQEDVFEWWWLAYPRRVSKGQARRAYERVLKSQLATADELQRGAEHYARQRAGQDPRYTKHPATWLNAECWKDEAPAAPAVGHASAMAGILRAVTGPSRDDEITEAAARARSVAGVHRMIG
jgi:hypothetical protein